MNAERADEKETGGETAGNRAGSVQRIEEADLPADIALPADQRARHRGKRPAHQERRGQDHCRREHESDGGQCGRIRGEPGRCMDVERIEKGDGERAGQRGDPDSDLQKAIKPEGTVVAIGVTPQRPASQGETAEERGEHGRDRVRRDAEYVFEQARPDDLVDETGRAGKKEQEVDSTPARAFPHRLAV